MQKPRVREGFVVLMELLSKDVKEAIAPGLIIKSYIKQHIVSEVAVSNNGRKICHGRATKREEKNSDRVSVTG